MTDREAIILAVARDNVLIGEDLIGFLLAVKEPVQLVKRVIKDLRAEGEDLFVLKRDDIIRWSQKDPENRRVLR